MVEQITQLKLSTIVKNPYQPRLVFDEDKLKNEICIHCKVFNLSFMYAKIIRDDLIQKFKSDGISIKNAVFYPPSEFRHPAEIEQFLDDRQS